MAAPNTPGAARLVNYTKREAFRLDGPDHKALSQEIMTRWRTWWMEDDIRYVETPEGTPFALETDPVVAKLAADFEPTYVKMLMKHDFMRFKGGIPTSILDGRLYAIMKEAIYGRFDDFNMPLETLMNILKRTPGFEEKGETAARVAAFEKDFRANILIGAKGYRIIEKRKRV